MREIGETADHRVTGAVKGAIAACAWANDPRVKKAESDRIVAALCSRGVAVRHMVMVKENEGHGFQNEVNRFGLYRAMGRFPAEHPGSRREPRPGRAGFDDRPGGGTPNTDTRTAIDAFEGRTKLLADHPGEAGRVPD